MTDITNEKPPIPAGFHERLGYNADFRLDWHDPDEATDGYQLKWLGKDYARLQAGTAPATVIVPDAEHNALPENAASGNIFLTGDNLEVLKHLQNAYSGSVDMIYIDPPYNTGKEFVYSDKFDFTDDQLKDMLGMTDNEIKRLHTINGRSSHSAWLTFMYPRLKIAQKLLKDTGVIFISIDDNEQANLKLLCDEVLNEGKFVNTIIWQKSMGGGTSPTIISGHDYILVYQKQKRMLFGNDFVPNPNDVRIINGLEYFIDKNPIHKEHGIRGTNEERYVYYEDLKPEEKEKYDTEYYIKKRDTNGKHFIYKLKTVERKKAFWNILNEIDFIKDKSATTGAGIQDIIDIGLPQEIFDFPKPVGLIKQLLNAPYEEGDIKSNENALILDFFAGSGTTAHAVMQLNAEDGGNRRWILAQLDEPTAEGSEARKAGYETIDEIARKRIKRAAEKIKHDAGLNGGNLDLGFHHYRVKAPAALTIDKITEFDPSEPAPLIADDMVAEMGGIGVILATWLTADGYPLDRAPEAIDIAGFTAHYIGNSMLYIIEQGWGKEQTKALLNLVGTHKLNLNTIIVYGYSFTLESMRELEINVMQSLNKQVSIEKRY